MKTLLQALTSLRNTVILTLICMKPVMSLAIFPKVRTCRTVTLWGIMIFSGILFDHLAFWAS